jgi:omega-amidase
MQISLAQINVQMGEPAKNQVKVEEMIQEASRRKSDFLLLPELWASGYDLANCHDYATPLGNGLFYWLSDQARINRIFIGGSLLEECEGKIYNTFTLFSSEGKLAALYRKTHLFRLMQEDQWLCAGDALVSTQLPWGKAGMAICYDLRFPEIFRSFLGYGATMAFLPAEWPLKRISHWDTLLRARAIENQLFMIAANRVGESAGELFGGHSCIIDPWGETIIAGGADEVLLTAQVDLGESIRIRRIIPVIEDRRQDLY